MRGERVTERDRDIETGNGAEKRETEIYSERVNRQLCPRRNLFFFFLRQSFAIWLSKMCEAGPNSSWSL